MNGYIYIIRNTCNDKVYIGQSINDLKVRFREHINKSRRQRSKFYNAIQALGEDKFSINLIEECDKSLLNEREKYWISKFNSFHNGYNSTLGGEGTHTYELDEDYIIKLYESYGLTYIASMYGCCTKVIRSILIRNNIKLRESNNEAIQVVMLNKNYIPLLIFKSKKAAWRWLIQNYRSNMKLSEAYTYIKRACDYGNTAFGYKWMYLADVDVSDKQSIMDNIEVQRYNKNNIVKVTNPVSISNANPDKIVSHPGKPGTPCYIKIDGEQINFKSLKDLAGYISKLDGTNITDDKKLGYKAYNIKESLEKHNKYKGYIVGYL